MKALVTQIVILLVLVFMVYIVLKVSGFIGGKEESEKKELPFLHRFKKKQPSNTNKTIQVNDWSIVELDDVGYPTSHSTEISFTEGKFYIGRDNSNDFVLENMTVSGRHAVILDTPKGLVLRNEKTSANGVKHNGKLVDDILLEDGMILQFGKVFCKIHLENPGNNFLDDGISGRSNNDWDKFEETIENDNYIQRKL